MDKKGSPATAVVLLVIAAIVVVFLFGKTGGSVSSAIKKNWGLDIPSKAKCNLEYSRDSGASFNGDGLRYHVYSYKDSASIGMMVMWEVTQQRTIFYNSYEESCEAWLDELKVPRKERPSYGDCMYWYACQNDNSEIIIFRDDSLKLLYIIESFL